MEVNKTSQSTKTAWWKKYTFVIVGFLSSLPLIALGIWGIVFNYHPYSVWQTNNMYWIRSVALILFVLIVEFVIVFLPTIIVNLKKRGDTSYYKFYKNNLRKELSFNLVSYQIAWRNAKKEKNRMLAKQIANDMGEAKLLYYAKLKELMKQNKKNKTS